MRSIENARVTLIKKRDNLLRRRAELHVEEHQLLDQYESDLPDVAAERTAADLMDRLDASERQHLEQVHAAIARIDAGTWGRCASCGRRIPAARLRALPETDRCARCSVVH
jgi:DnaK suppressor protein